MKRLWTEHRHDLVLGLMMSAVFALAISLAGETVPGEVLDYDYYDVWYEGDSPKVFANLTEGEDHKRVWRHPFFIVLTHPAVLVLTKVFIVPEVAAVRTLLGSLAFVWMLTFFSVLRLLGCRRWDTVLFCILAGVSSASVYWFTVPETFSFGSWSILLALLVVVLSQMRMVRPVWLVGMNIATLSFVISNFVAGALATLATQTVKRAMAVMGVVLAGGLLLWGLQTVLYPETASVTGKPIDPWEWNVINPFSGTYKDVTASFFFHSLIMPEFHTAQKPGMDVVIMLTQLSAPGSATGWGTAAVVVWALLLSLGAWALFCSKGNLKFRLVLGALLAEQLALHVLYGSETFLYALHFIVLLIPLAAMASLTRFRGGVIALMIVLIPCVAMNNLTQFHKAKEFIRQQTGKV